MDLVKHDVQRLENHTAITVVRSRPRDFVAAVIGFTVAMIDGYDTLALSFIAPVIAGEWTLAPSTVGWIFAFSYAGAALGATIVGLLSDRFGRTGWHRPGRRDSHEHGVDSAARAVREAQCSPALAVHLYPASVYGTGVGLSMAIGRIGSIAGPLVVGYLVSTQIGWNSLFPLTAVPSSSRPLP